jgi:DNA-binding response OmpR family regulator
MNATAERRNEEKTTAKTVLIVDALEETRDVLTTALERRGVRALAFPTSKRAAATARTTRPDLVIFDVEAEVASPRQALDAFAKDAELDETPIVAIGTARFEAPLGEGTFISKPYHFAPLLEKIEALLREADERE